MSRQTILIIDDTPDHCDILSRFLQSVGYRVVAASPGSDAVAQAQREHPDLILAALSLPGQPAWETARLLRATPAFAKTPFLGTTVYSTILSSSRIRAMGFEELLSKPFDFDGLLHHIGRLMPSSPFAAAA